MFQSVPNNIGLQNDFYGEPGQGSLDDGITNIEKDQSARLDKFRSSLEDYQVLSDKIPELVISLSVRSRWLREEFAQKINSMVSELSANLPNHMPKLIQDQPQIKMLKRRGISQKVLDDALQDFLPKMQSLISAEQKKIRRYAQAAHNNALGKALIPEARVMNCNLLHWTILVRPPGTFILSDVGPIFKTAINRYKALPDKGDPILAVALPFSHTHLLIGTREDSEFPTIDELNSASAKCSYEFFVSSCKSDEVQKLSTVIGDWSSMVSEQELKSIAEECFSTLQLD
ncbi:MAG: hypothetical protein JWM16_5884 [Verrucomicrobiales bacterium]|nr:hypothetical protein [Verrucomicrobiales bacterium]